MEYFIKTYFKFIVVYTKINTNRNEIIFTFTSKKMNIAFLHGCCQNKEMFESIMKSYIKVLTKANFFSNFSSFNDGNSENDNTIKCIFLEGEYDHSRCGKMWFKIWYLII